MNTAYFYLTDEGGKLAHKLATAHPGDIYNKENFKENLSNKKRKIETNYIKKYS